MKEEATVAPQPEPLPARTFFDLLKEQAEKGQETATLRRVKSVILLGLFLRLRVFHPDVGEAEDELDEALKRVKAGTWKDFLAAVKACKVRLRELESAAREEKAPDTDSRIKQDFPMELVPTPHLPVSTIRAIYAGACALENVYLMQDVAEALYQQHRDVWQKESDDLDAAANRIVDEWIANEYPQHLSSNPLQQSEGFRRLAEAALAPTIAFQWKAWLRESKTPQTIRNSLKSLPFNTFLDGSRFVLEYLLPTLNDDSAFRQQLQEMSRVVIEGLCCMATGKYPKFTFSFYDEQNKEPVVDDRTTTYTEDVLRQPGGVTILALLTLLQDDATRDEGCEAILTVFWSYLKLLSEKQRRVVREMIQEFGFEGSVKKFVEELPDSSDDTGRIERGSVIADALMLTDYFQYVLRRAMHWVFEDLRSHKLLGAYDPFLLVVGELTELVADFPFDEWEQEKKNPLKKNKLPRKCKTQVQKLQAFLINTTRTRCKDGCYKEELKAKPVHPRFEAKEKDIRGREIEGNRLLGWEEFIYRFAFGEARERFEPEVIRKLLKQEKDFSKVMRFWLTCVNKEAGLNKQEQTVAKLRFKALFFWSRNDEEASEMIAKKLHLKPGTFRQVKKRAMDKLKPYLEKLRLDLSE